MIRIDNLWLCTQPLDMRAGAERLLARVVQVFGSAQAHHAYLRHTPASAFEGPISKPAVQHLVALASTARPTWPPGRAPQRDPRLIARSARGDSRRAAHLIAQEGNCFYYFADTLSRQVLKGIFRR